MPKVGRPLYSIAGRGKLGGQVTRRDRDGRLRISNVMAQFLCSIHWVDRHHDSVCAKNRIVRDDELRAVLHDHQHPVTSPNAKNRELRGQAFSRARKFLVSDAAVKEG